MALKNLTDEEMVEVSAGWLDRKRLRPALEAHAVLAALLPEVHKAHDALVHNTAPAGGDAARDTQRAQLYQKGVAIDQRHDRKGRGVFNLLTALADLSDEPEHSAQYIALRDQLFPDGNLAVLTATWKGEAGNARRVKDTVLGEKGVVTALKAIPLPGHGTLHDGVRDFVALGHELGAVEDERVKLGEPADDAPGGDARSARPSARNRWVALGNNIVRLVDEVLGLQGSARHAVLGALEDAERRADARTAARRPAETGTTPPGTGSTAPAGGG